MAFQLKELRLSPSKKVMVESVESRKAKVNTFQLRQTVGLVYNMGEGGQSNNLFGGGLGNLFEGAETETKIYPTERVCWVDAPSAKFPTVESFQKHIDSIEGGVFIREIYGLNPIGMRPSYEYALEQGLRTMEQIIESNLKMTGNKDNLSPMMTTYKGKQVPLYSMKQLTSIKSIGGKAADLDFLEGSLRGGKYSPLLLEVAEETTESVLGFEPADEWS